MADDRRALRARRPVLAGLVVTRGKCAAVGLRTREDVVPVRRVAAAVDDLALLAERGLLGEVVGRPVQVGNVLGDHSALGVLPRSLADAVARVDGRLAVGGLRGEISAPGLAAGAAGLGQLLALRIGPPPGRRDRRPCQDRWRSRRTSCRRTAPAPMAPLARPRRARGLKSSRISQCGSSCPPFVLSLAARFQPDAGPLIPMPRCERPKRKRRRARSTTPLLFMSPAISWSAGSPTIPTRRPDVGQRSRLRWPRPAARCRRQLRRYCGRASCR